MTGGPAPDRRPRPTSPTAETPWQPAFGACRKLEHLSFRSEQGVLIVRPIAETLTNIKAYDNFNQEVAVLCSRKEPIVFDLRDIVLPRKAVSALLSALAANSKNGSPNLSIIGANEETREILDGMGLKNPQIIYHQNEEDALKVVAKKKNA